MSGRFAILATIAAGLLLAPPAVSQQVRIVPGQKKGLGARANLKGLPLLDRLHRMNPAQRRRFLENVPPPRRRILEQRLRDYDRMTPDERRQAARSLENFQNLPEERRQRVRRLHNVLLRMPQDRQDLLRQEMRALDELDPSERRTRMESSEFREKYGPMERRWLEELTRALYEDEE